MRMPSHRAAGLPHLQGSTRPYRSERREMWLRNRPVPTAWKNIRDKSAKKFVSDVSRQKRLGDQLVQALAQVPNGPDSELIWNLDGWDEIEGPDSEPLIHDEAIPLLVSVGGRIGDARGALQAAAGGDKIAWSTMAHRRKLLAFHGLCPSSGEGISPGRRHGGRFALTTDGATALGSLAFSPKASSTLPWAPNPDPSSRRKISSVMIFIF